MNLYAIETQLGQYLADLDRAEIDEEEINNMMESIAEVMTVAELLKKASYKEISAIESLLEQLAKQEIKAIRMQDFED